MTPIEVAALFLVVFLAPIIPAAVVFHLIPNATAEAEGKLFNLSVKAGGAFGAYVVICLFAAAIYSMIAGDRLDPRRVRLQIAVKGELPLVANFFNVNSRRLGFVISNDSDAIGEFIGFKHDPFRQQLESADIVVDAPQLGKTFKIAFSPAIPDVRLSKDTVVLREVTRAELVIDMEKIALAYGLNIIEKSYLNDKLGYRLRSVEMIENRSDRPVDLVDFGPDDQEVIQRYVFSARRITAADAERLKKNWSRDALRDLNEEEVAKRFDQLFGSVDKYGEELGFSQFEEQKQGFGLRVEPTAKRGEVVRVMFGPTPRLQNIPGGLRKDGPLLVYSEIVGESATAVPEGKLQLERYDGTTPKMEADRLILIVGATGNVKLSQNWLPIRYRHWSGAATAFGDPVEKRGEKYRVLDLASVERLSHVAVPTILQKK